MYFEKGYIYHIYNQGNNRQKIFFKEENYLFFLKKIKTHILPYAEILAWCLMPNHFHLMVFVNDVVKESIIGGSTLSDTAEAGTIGGATLSDAVKAGTTGGATLSRTPNITSFNKSIGIMLASYTRAINKQNKTTGSLFRDKTKAECVNCNDGVTPAFITTGGVAQINAEQPEQQYPQLCFNYIHNNPVKAGLVKEAEKWRFSSAIDYAGLRNGKLINRKIAKEYGFI
jgi:putative transposase